MPRRTLCLLFGLSLALVSAAAHSQASGGPPLPIPGAEALTVRVTVTGPFRSYTIDEKRNITMDCWVATAEPGTPVDFTTIADQAFQRLSLPEEEGWGRFHAEHAGPLTLRVAVTDTMRRLWRVAIRKAGAGRPIAYLPASMDGGEVSGAVAIDWLDREFTADIEGLCGSPLAVLAIDAGRYDAMVPLVFHGACQPHVPRPSELGCDAAADARAIGTFGNPFSSAGTVWTLAPAPAARTFAGVPYVHDESWPISLGPPREASWTRRSWVDATATWIDPNIEPASARRGLFEAMSAETKPDMELALASFKARPYSRGTAEWEIEFRGDWLAAITVPYERMRLGGDVAWLQARTERAYRAGVGRPEERLAAAARSVLADARWERLLGFHASEVRAYSSAAGVSITQTGLRAVGETPVLQEITLRFEAYKAPSGGGGEVRIAYDRPMTDPPAPGATTTIRAPIENWTSRVMLPQGHCWKIVADVRAPDLYITSPREHPFQSGGTAEHTVSVVPATMADLTIETVGQGGIPVAADVTIRGLCMEAIGTGRTSPNRTTGRCTYRFRECVAQGTLTIEAKTTDGRHGTQTFFVPQPGIDHVTVELR